MGILHYMFSSNITFKDFIELFLAIILLASFYEKKCVLSLFNA